MIFELSVRAKADVESIYRYTQEFFGDVQAAEYLGGLFRSFELLTGNPQMGRVWRPGRRRYIYRMHHIYYRVSPTRVFVTHIRHSSQNPLP